MPVIGSSAYRSSRMIMTLVRSLLNDYGQPGLPVDIVTANRIGGTVQIHTSGPHGMILGDQAVIDSVADSSFDGTFDVSLVTSPTDFQYVQAGADASSTGGFSTGVGLGNVYTDPVLLPYLNSAYRVVQRALAMCGQTTFKVDLLFFVVTAVASVDPSVQVVVDEATAPPNNLPVDLIEPLELWERPYVAGPSDQSFLPMHDVTNSGGLPSVSQSQRLGVWEWREDGIWFVGATQDVQVRMRYRKFLPILSDGESQVLIRNSEECMAFITAAMAAQSRGSTLAEKYDAAGQDSLERLIQGAARQQQRTVRRRRPYSSRRSGYGRGWI